MLRYVYIGDQIIEDGEQFAFYDTVTNKFLEYSDCTVFDDLDDLFEVYDSKKYPQYSGTRIMTLMPLSMRKEV